ncbi:MAG: hypothetical protein DMF68_15235 [Acidobacteria bacterium]|nr:MAG: hypothetical protein DMF68_15235 [Acidobacteriota bacterium]
MKYCPVCKSQFDDGVSFCPKDGEVLEDDATSLVDSVLDGQYHIESMLGKGGMGAVYCARHILLGDKVAIKVLPPQMRNNAEWLRRFRREGQAARRFRHPNAVTVYDLRTTTDGLVYMVMEFVEGYTLDAELKRRGRFSPLEAFTVLEPVMSVLNAAHAMGVVHRDLKPENIMLGKPGDDGLPVTKLLDLGIAKMREVAGADASGTTALTMAGQVLGTPFYMSPEQWGEVPKDGNTEIDGRADIYSLSVVFYEIVAGRRPFTGLTLQELRREHVTVSPRPLNEVAPDVSEAFNRAILRAMSKDRDERQATAGELAAELRASLDLPALAGSSPSLNVASGAQSSGQSSQTSGGTSGAGSTSENMDRRGTSADVIAPTIITVDAPPRPRQDNQQPLAATSLAQPASTTQPPQTPSFPSLNQPAPSYAPAAEAPRRSSKTPLIIAIAAVLLIGAGVGVWFLMSNRSGVSSTSTAGAGGATASAKEALGYWLEVAEAGPNGESARVAGTVPLSSGQSFKFHFKPVRDGYLYIIGPGEENAPSTFLTNKPNGDFAKTNEVKAGSEFTFPAGDDNWIELDKKPGTEIYTIIFSPTRLSEPAFFGEDAADLTATEQKVFEDFKNKYKANAPETAVLGGGGTDPLVSVKIPQAAENEPVIFDVRIEHK